MGEEQHKPARVRNGTWYGLMDDYQHTLEMMLLGEGLVWKMAQSKVRVKDTGSTHEGVRDRRENMI